MDESKIAEIATRARAELAAALGCDVSVMIRVHPADRTLAAGAGHVEHFPGTGGYRPFVTAQIAVDPSLTVDVFGDEAAGT